MNVKIALRKDKKNAHGLYPVVIQVAEKKRVERVALGFAIPSEDFDEVKQTVSKRNSNYKNYNELLNEAKRKISLTLKEVETLKFSTIRLPATSAFKDLYQASSQNIQNIQNKYRSDYKLVEGEATISSNPFLREVKIPINMKVPASKYNDAINLLQKLLRNELDPKIEKMIAQQDTDQQEKEQYFLEVWDKYYNYCLREKAPATAIRIPNNLTILKTFSETTHIPLTFDSFNEDFGSELKFYLLNDHFNYITKKKGISNGTVHNIQKSISAFLNWCFKKGYTASVEFKKWEKKKPKSDLQYLTEPQLKQLFKHKLVSGSNLDKTRDLWLFSAFSGMRWGDMEKWLPSNVTPEGLIKYRSEKVKKDCTVGLNEVTRAILKKYKGKLPTESDAKANKNIKKVLAEIGFDKITVNRIISKGTQDIIKQMPFSESITLHSARRSFINLMISKGRSVAHLSTMVGNDVKSLMVYYKDDSSQMKKIMDEVTFFK